LRLASLVAVAITALALTGAAHGSTNDLSLTVDETSISTELGRTFVFHSTITNHGATPVSSLIAHLNVLSLRDGVYVDPEDWSSQRTRYLAPIPAGGSLTLTWKLQAVNSGSIGVYIAVLPQTEVGQPPLTGPAIHVTIAERKTLNAGGVLPLVLGIPALLGTLALTLRVRRRTA
jgi:hypothetical protein